MGRIDGPELLMGGLMLIVLLCLDMIINPAGIVDRVSDARPRFRSDLEWLRANIAPEPAPGSPGRHTAMRAFGAAVIVIAAIYVIERV